MASPKVAARKKRTSNEGTRIVLADLRLTPDKAMWGCKWIFNRNISLTRAEEPSFLPEKEQVRPVAAQVAS